MLNFGKISSISDLHLILKLFFQIQQMLDYPAFFVEFGEHDFILNSYLKPKLNIKPDTFDLFLQTTEPFVLLADGGPGLTDIARVLQGSESRDEDLATLLRAQLLFWMLAATDGHAKNFSIRLLQQGRYRLMPLYDVLSAWPVTGSRQNRIHPKKLKLAMALRGESKHYRVEEITRRHFNATARRCGLGAGMESVIDDIIAGTPW